MAMQPLSPEDREFFQALSGERPGTPAEQALRADMLELGRLKHEIAEDDEALSPEQQARRERVMVKLRQEGLLPVADPIQPKEVDPQDDRSDALSKFLGLLGIQLRGGGSGGLVVSPVAAVALAAAVGLAVHSYGLKSGGEPSGPPDFVTRGTELTVYAKDPTAKCKAIEAALLGTKLKAGEQVQVALDNPDECRVLALELNSEADRDAAIAIFRLLDLDIKSQSQIEVTVKRPPRKS